MLRAGMKKLAAVFLGYFQKQAQSGLARNPLNLKKQLEQGLQEPRKMRGPISKIKREIGLLLDLVRSWIQGEYRVIPVGTIIMVAGALLYLIAPLDAVPDLIPFAGLIDDAFILGLTLNQIRSDLRAYEKWKLSRPPLV